MAELALDGFDDLVQLGRGGFGAVYRARSRRTGELVAVKVMHHRPPAAAARQLDQEIQLLATLSWHPGIVQIVDAGADADGRPWIAMELVEGGSLGDRLRTQPPPPPPVVAGWGVQAANALAVAHHAGVLHRDVKPDNLLVTGAGDVKLGDFGVALAAGTAGSQRTTGTIAYAAPELLAGMPSSTATDVYALGATLYALLAGGPAYARPGDESPAAIALRAIRDPVPDLTDLGVPAPLARVVRRAMAKDPADRPASAAALQQELESASRELGWTPPAVVRAPSGTPAPRSTAPTAAPPAPPRGRSRWQRALAPLAGVAAALLAVSVLTVTRLGDDAPDDAAAPPATAPGDPGATDPAAAGDDDAAEVPDLAEPPLPPVPSQLEPTAPPSAPPPPEEPVGGVPLPADAVDLVVTGGAAVVGLPDAVVRFEGGTAAARADLSVVGLAADEDVVAVATPAQVTLLDPAALRPLAAVGITATDVAVGGGAVWAATTEGLVRIDPAGGPPTTVATGTATAVAVGTAGTWAVVDGTLLHLPTQGGPAVPAPGVTVADLAALGEDALVATSDGDVVRVATDGTGVVVAGGLDVRLVAAGPSELIGLATASQVGVLRDGTLVELGTGAATAIAVTDGAVLAALQGPPRLVELNG